MNRVSPELELTVLAVLNETHGIRRTSKITGVCKNTVSRIARDENTSWRLMLLRPLVMFLEAIKAQRAVGEPGSVTPTVGTGGLSEFDSPTVVLSKKSDQMIELESNRIALRQAATATGISYKTLCRRILHDGMTAAEALACGSRKNSIIGRRYGKLFVTSRGKDPDAMIVRCDCGAEKTVRRQALSSGRVTSCGCKRAVAMLADSDGTVSVFGNELSIGQLATISGRGAVAIAARMRRGSTAEEAAFGR